MNISALYRWALQAHQWVPYHFMQSGRALPAWHYFLEVTRRCNLRCMMCQYIDWFRETSAAVQKEGELTTDEWKNVIDQTGRLSLLSFTGGEPFVRNDFIEILEHAAQKRRAHIISNGTLLTEDRAAQCVALAPKRIGGTGLGFIGVSLDGPRDLHDHIRGLPGAFDKSMNGIQAVLAHRRAAKKACPMIHVTAVIQSANVEALPQMVEVVANAGVDVLNLTLEVRWLNLEGLGDASPGSFSPDEVPRPRIEPAQLEKALRDTRSAAAKAGIELRTPAMPDSEIVQYYSGGWDLRQFECRSAWSTLIVGRDGDVYPCWLKRIGNVREHSLKTLWQNQAMRQFRTQCRTGLFAPCQGCCLIQYKGK